jgi:hypothetical protein
MAAKRFFCSLCLVILLITQPIFCQIGKSQTEPLWPLEVSKFEINVGDQGAFGASSRSSGLGSLRTSSSTSGGAGGQQKVSFSLKAKNPSNDKTIKTIEWEANFFDTQNKPVKNQFKTKKKIKPTKDETLEETIFFNTTSLPSTVKLGFRIKKIEYEDNSVWENKAPDTDSNFVYNSANVN